MYQSIERVRKNTIILNKCLNIAFVILAIAFIIALTNLFKLINADVELFTIGESLAFQNYEICNKMVSFNSSDIDITFLQEKSEIKSAVIIFGVITIICFLLILPSCYAFKMLLITIINDQPFSGGISRYLMFLGYSIGISQILISLSSGIAQLLFGIFIDGYHRGFLFSLKPEILFTFFAYSTLASIFKYGEELQQDVEGTV